MNWIDYIIVAVVCIWFTAAVCIKFKGGNGSCCEGKSRSDCSKCTLSCTQKDKKRNK